MGGSAQLGAVSAGLQVGLSEGRGGTAQPTSPVMHVMFEFRECPIFSSSNDITLHCGCANIFEAAKMLRTCCHHVLPLYTISITYHCFFACRQEADAACAAEAFAASLQRDDGNQVAAGAAAADCAAESLTIDGSRQQWEQGPGEGIGGGGAGGGGGGGLGHSVHSSRHLSPQAAVAAAEVDLLSWANSAPSPTTTTSRSSCRCCCYCCYCCCYCCYFCCFF